MAKCEHNLWVELVQDHAVPQLKSASRLARLVGELPEPAVQSPQIVFFMGRKLKDQALRQLCRSNYRGNPRHGRSITLRSDNRTLYTRQPRFFADCDPTNRALPTAIDSIRHCHEERVYPLELPAVEYTLHDLIMSRLLFLVVDVICIFADDVGGLEGVRRLLSTWITIGSASSLPHTVRPRVIVATSSPESITHSLLDEEDFLFQLFHVGKLQSFSAFGDIQISRLPAEELSPDARYVTLGGDISRQLQLAKNDRAHHRVLFSGKHLSAFFEAALHHARTQLLLPFNFILAARQQNPIDGAFTSHLINFLRLGNQTRAPYDEMASYIASAILMDAYPPGMHSEYLSPSHILYLRIGTNIRKGFNPAEVFQKLYEDTCYRALRKCYSTDALASLQCSRIKEHLNTLFDRMEKSLKPSSEIHKHNLAQQQKYWSWARSNITCLFCLRRHPEHTQVCGHAICDTCTEIFGERTPHRESEYVIRKCILCGNSKYLTVRLKPVTAAPRVLSIDGGGPRGIIPLENLEILQEILGPEIPLVDMFELKAGTSAGGIIVLSWTIIRLPISECKKMFQSLTKSALSPKCKKGLLSRWLSDETYDSQVFEDILKEHYGPTRRLFDPPPSLVCSGKVVVTASSINDGAPFIFTNYNGAAPHRAEPGTLYIKVGANVEMTVLIAIVCGRLRPNVDDEPFIWQVARATSAAPPLFSTIDLPGIGTFQDGGMGRHNNPVNLALSESKHLWPSAPDPDVVITLGTASEVTVPRPSSFRNIVMDGWVPRVYRSLRASFDGRNTWKELEDRLDAGSLENFFRFDVSLPDGLPAMDNTGCMEHLSRQARKETNECYDIRASALALLTTCLFFKLEVMPEYREGLFLCMGTIRCRADARPLLKRLLELEPNTRGFYKDNLELGLRLSADDICATCHRYSLPVRFLVRDLHERFTLSLRLEGTARRLSAFPNTVQWFIDQQRLDCPFGSANHNVPFQMECPDCSVHAMGKGRKRKYIEI